MVNCSAVVDQSGPRWPAVPIGTMVDCSRACYWCFQHRAVAANRHNPDHNLVSLTSLALSLHSESGSLPLFWSEDNHKLKDQTKI